MPGKMCLLFLQVLLCSCAFAGTLYSNPEVSEISQVVSCDQGGVTVNFQLSSLESDDSGLIIRMSDEGIYAVFGMPDLPVARRMVQVPNYGTVEYEIISSECITINLHRDIPPFQPLPVRGEPRPQLVQNQEFYGGSASWPESPIVIETVEILRDIRIARVGYLPVSWNPASKELTVTTSVTVRFFTTDTPGVNELNRVVSSITESYMDFYNEVLGYSSEGDAENGCYLVISTQDGIERVSDLLDWKHRKGFQIETGIVPEIGSTATEIDAWIENAFNTWPVPPEYILLVGDADKVPSPTYNGHAADNIYGVIGSGCVPSIHVGRLSGETADDLDYEAWKIVQHEMDPFQSGDSWFQRGISVGHTEFIANSWDYMEYMMAAGMSPIWFCSAGGVEPTVTTLTDTLNSGVSIFGLCGHGNVSSVSPSGFSISDIAALSNGRKLGWFALVACQVGWFDGNYCFCEALMGEGSIGDPRGGIGAMGPTTNSPYGAADSLVKWIFKGYFQEEVHHMGAVTDWSKNEVFNYYGSSAIDNNHMHMLFGCPEMDIYYDTAPLTAVTCVHPEPVVPGATSITVNAGGAPLEGALVAVKIYNPDIGSWMVSDYSDPSGNVTFTVPSFAGDADVYVTATNFNMAPYLYQAVTSVDENCSDTLHDNASFQVGSSPCTGTLSLFCTIPPGVDSRIEIFDIMGRLVRTMPLASTGTEIHALWDRESSNGTAVPAGFYYCILKTGSSTLVRPVLML